MSIGEKAVKKHFEWKGKIETKVKVPLNTKEDIMLAYTPGVAAPCLEIEKDPNLSFELTARGNTVAVITDGTAILGLGDIGPEAGMPVMEGKAALFKAFGNVDAIPLCIKSKDTEEIVRTIKLLEGSFGGINLEDIAAPRCFEIEKRLKEELSIPVFHDDQHGTAIVVAAALINALKLVKKDLKDIKVVINGAGAAGIAIGKFLLKMGVEYLLMCDKNGILSRDVKQGNDAKDEIASLTNHKLEKGYLKDAMKNSDVFIGVSGPNLVSKEMIKSMNKDSVVFPLANPIPEISYLDSKEAGARVVGTGSNQFPNQINNVLAFPGLFRGALDVRAKDINFEMMLASAHAIADAITSEALSEECVIPLMTFPNLHEHVSNAVRKAAKRSGVSRK